MARMDTIPVDGSKLMQTVRLELRLPRAFGLRMRIAALCARAAGWLSGTLVSVVVDGCADEHDPDEHQGVSGTEAVRRIRNLVDQASEDGRDDPLVAHLRVLVPALALLTEERQEPSPTHPLKAS